MSVTTDFRLARYEDGILHIDMTPPTNIGGWSLRFQLMNRYDGVSGIIKRYSASGYDGLSGITLTNSGTGSFNIQLYGKDMSGLDVKNYSYVVERLTSGSRTVLAEGYLSMLPGGAP